MKKLTWLTLLLIFLTKVNLFSQEFKGRIIYEKDTVEVMFILPKTNKKDKNPPIVELSTFS